MLLMAATAMAAEDLARRSTAETRWASFENPSAGKGTAARENRGAKGHPADRLAAGETKTLMTAEGPGEIRRIWITVIDRNPDMLQSLRLNMHWDGAKTPAVSVPLGDFFGAILGRTSAFENELFANPEGRSFNCYIPMPFRTGARVTLTNESGRMLTHLFYDIDFLKKKAADEGQYYFHATWRRERRTTLGQDFEILPAVKGEGRFLGAHVGVVVNPENTGWWGEGEVKMYIDGDGELPTLAGTGTEDYIGTGWGQGLYHNRFQGCLVADKATGEYGFYRYHVPDPVYFRKDIRVTLQQIGGGSRKEMEALAAKGVVKPVSLDVDGKLVRLLEPHEPVPPTAPGKKDPWMNVYRRDDVSAVALFYLDRPENDF